MNTTTRGVVYAVHGCTNLRNEPWCGHIECDEPAWSGFVEDRRNCRFIGVFTTRTSAIRALEELGSRSGVSILGTSHDS